MFGHHAEVAYDGTAALEKARANPPDVMLCDLGLPGLTGYEVARALRTEGKPIRLVAVSGYAQPEDIAAAIDAGFERHVAKPLDPETVQNLLR
jgi:CheY-like chemotaxis protein